MNALSLFFSGDYSDGGQIFREPTQTWKQPDRWPGCPMLPYRESERELPEQACTAAIKTLKPHRT